MVFINNSPKSTCNLTYKVFIGGLLPTTDEDKLRKHFTSFGEIEDIEIIKQKNSYKPRGFAFIYFKNAQGLKKAISTVHHMDGRRLDCKEALNKDNAKSRMSQERNYKIFVGGLSQRTKEDALYDYFSMFGNVYKAYLIYDHNTHQSRCFGFVEFEDEYSLNLVLSNKRHIIDDNEVECKPVF